MEAPYRQRGEFLSAPDAQDAEKEKQRADAHPDVTSQVTHDPKGSPVFTQKINQTLNIQIAYLSSNSPVNLTFNVFLSKL